MMRNGDRLPSGASRDGGRPGNDDRQRRPATGADVTIEAARSLPDPGEQPNVVNGVSELVKVLGETGLVAGVRGAIGVADWPRRAPAGIELVAGVRGEPREATS
jgi:hypothetical protein